VYCVWQVVKTRTIISNHPVLSLCCEVLTRTFEFLVVQIRHVLSLQLVRREAPGVQPQTGHPPQPACQPSQVTVTDEIVVRQTEGAQSVHVLEHVLAERRQVVVVQGPGTWNKD